ncbi:MAG: hypothetical protein JWN73_2283 [Betaproteobacteria bacterium]|nr:hypothetical protein [Betaproteobacteria bacterium]
MKSIPSRIALSTLALLLAAPVFAATDSGPGAGATGSNANAEDLRRSSNGYKYDHSMNAGGRAGGSTVSRGMNSGASASNESNGYKYDHSMNAGGRAGGSTVPRDMKANGDMAGKAGQ